MSYGLVAWCAGSMAACAAATVGVSVLPTPSGSVRTRPAQAASIDPLLGITIPGPPAAIVGLTALDAIDVAAPLATTASLFESGPRHALRPAFTEPSAELRLEDITPSAEEPGEAARRIVDEQIRGHDLSRALVRPPPRPAFLSAAQSTPPSEPARPTSGLFASLLPTSLFGAPEAGRVTDRSGRAMQSGMASWYGPGFHGRKTASGEIFNQHAMTAAHRTLPFGTKVRVVDPTTGRSVIVRINDRGPYAHNRVIDLSRASAEALGLTLRGHGKVQLVSAE